MDWITQLFGKTENLDGIYMCARGILVFITALVMLRLSGKRTFGKESAIDTLVMIMLGGILSRVVTGAAAYLPVMGTTLAIIILHRLLAWLCMRYKTLDHFIKGKKMLLFERGDVVQQNMNKALISYEDLEESVRLSLNEEGTERADKIYMETCGDLSVVKKQGAS